MPTTSHLPASESAHSNKVFISCAAEDQQVAAQVAARMRDAGLEATLATDIPPQVNIGEKIRAAIAESLASVVLLSPSTAHPSSSLSTEWTSILNRTWQEPTYPLYTLKLTPEIETPVFLRSSLTYTLPESSKAAAEALKRLAQSVVSPGPVRPTVLTEEDIERIRQRIAALREAVGKALEDRGK